ncbi:MAG TPA: LON peptidase substrate-binding domain-containing protein [Cyclobacteriaceae bacterium]|nr:LON peptidase substrate-binding domain-containing protein [Cyclobacteriaceae bacterium]
MNQKHTIPVFPLSILPIPGELVPLHIFEPRYKQLLEEVERKDISFGIYYSNNNNSGKVGSIVKLESVIKKYPGGESDIIVKCTDMFTLLHFFKKLDDKLYPGGVVDYWNINTVAQANDKLTEAFKQYMHFRNIAEPQQEPGIYEIANELSLDFTEKMKFIYLTEERKQRYLLNQIEYNMKIISQEQKSKDIFYLN